MNCFKQQNSEENPLILLNSATSHQTMTKSKSANSLKQNDLTTTTSTTRQNINVIQDFEQRYQHYQDQIQEENMNRYQQISEMPMSNSTMNPIHMRPSTSTNYFYNQLQNPNMYYHENQPINMNVNILKTIF